MLERISINGFLRAFRCVGLGGTNVNDKYFIIYDLRSKDILLSKYHYPSSAICEVINTKSLTSGLSSFFVTIRYLTKNNEIEILQYFRCNRE